METAKQGGNALRGASSADLKRDEGVVREAVKDYGWGRVRESEGLWIAGDLQEEIENSARRSGGERGETPAERDLLCGG